MFGSGNLLELQTRFMKVLGITRDDVSHRDAHILDAVTGLVCEASEVLSDLRLRNRPWKEQPEAAHTIEESIDVLFFLLEFWSLQGLSSEAIGEVYFAKLIKNLYRIISKSRERDVKIALDYSHQADITDPTPLGQAIKWLQELGYDDTKIWDVWAEVIRQ